MPAFDFTAIELRSGRKRQGTIDGDSLQGATSALKASGLAPTSIQPKPVPQVVNQGAPHNQNNDEPAGAAYCAAGRKRVWTFGRVISRKRLTLFTRQLATLLRAGMPLLRALEVLARPERNAAFKEVLSALAGAIRDGGSLSDGLRLYPRIFDALYLTMVQAGEAGGLLDHVLDRLARFLERTERIKGRVKAAMTYPAIIILVAGGILTGLMVFVVPKFQQIFNGVLKGQPLPPLTRLVIGVGDFVHLHFVAALSLPALAYLAWRIVRRSPRGIRYMDWLLIRSPLLGDLFLKASVARFARTFGSLIESGVPILNALTITCAASGNVHVTDAVAIVHDRVKEGNSVARALEVAGVFPGMVSSMIEVGEETGTLSEMLGRVADAYDEEVDNAVAALTSIIEPVMIVVMALVVGIIVIALFLPIVGIVQHLQ